MTTGLLLVVLVLFTISLWEVIQRRRECSRQAKIIEATSCGVVVTDAATPGHPIRSVNQGFRSLTGYADHELIGQTMALLTGVDTERGSIEKLAMALQDGRACRVCLRHYRKNGTSFWNEVTLSPVNNRAGRLTSMIWVMSDVSHRQKTDGSHSPVLPTPTVLSDLAVEGMIVVTEAGIAYVNRAGLTLLGAVSDEQILGKRYVEIVHSDSQVAVRLRMVQRQVFSDTHAPLNARFLRIDGQSVDVELSVTSLGWEGKEATLFCFSEMTSRHRHEQDVLFEAVIETAPNGMMLIRQEGTISLVNTLLERMFGYSREELRGQPVERVLPTWSHVFAEKDGIVENGAVGGGQIKTSRVFSGFRKDGSEVLVEIEMNPVPMARGAAVLLTVVDRAARQQDEQVIRDSEKRFDLAVQAGQVGIFEHDHQTSALYWSPIFRDIYGVTTDEPASVPRHHDLVHPDDRDRVVSLIQRAHASVGDGLFEVEHRILRPDGAIRHIHLRSVTFFDGEGIDRHPIHTIGTVVDITDRKNAEAQQRQASKMEAIGTFAGGIAHEFNNSLTAVLGFSELALPLIPTGSKAYRHLSQVIVAGRKSRELVHQLLTFSRQSDQVRCPLSLHSLIKEALKLLRPTIPLWIELQEQIAKSTNPILANTTQMHQMILNLIENALHAMRKSGGILDIQLLNKEFSSDHVTPHGTLPAGCYVCLIVRDTGEGMEAEIASRIFEPFFTTKGVGEGRGMGLSVVHGIVTTHGGTIFIESEIGVGTTVSVYFPALPPRASLTPDKDEPLPRGHECILFVDDEDSLARCGAEMLESLGYYPVVRTTAAEAWEAFQVAPQQFDLLITDQTMPGMNGDLLARECQRLRPDLPVILCSGSDHILSQDATCLEGIAAFALKPLMLRELAHMIRRVLDRSLSTYQHVERGSHSGHELSTLSIEVSDAVSPRH